MMTLKRSHGGLWRIVFMNSSGSSVNRATRAEPSLTTTSRSRCRAQTRGAAMLISVKHLAVAEGGNLMPIYCATADVAPSPVVQR